MILIQSQPSKLIASDIFHYSDAELNQYLEVNKRLDFFLNFLFFKFIKIYTKTC